MRSPSFVPSEMLFACVLLLTACGGSPALPLSGTVSTTIAQRLAAGEILALCGSSGVGHATCFSYGVTATGLQSLGYPSRSSAAMGRELATRKKMGSSSPVGYLPADLQSAYNINPSGGSGRTVALVEAWDTPQVESDLAVYRSTFGLPPCTTANGCFLKVNQTGSTNNLPAVNNGWGQETTLDVDMVSAMCPNCRISVVEANSSSYSDLAAAENTAASLNPFAISNSFGSSGGADPNAAAYDHPGIAIFVAAGDGGYLSGVSTPAAFNTVIAVGGTTLTRGGGGSRGWTESVWNASQSACTAVAKPAWQTDSGCSGRTVADVAFDADNATGVGIYFSPVVSGWGGGWVVTSGTSIGSPALAAIYALAGCVSTTAKFLYTYASQLTDITTGGTTGCSGCNNPGNGYYGIEAASSQRAKADASTACSLAYLCNAGVGYDAPSGSGVPNGLAAFQAPCAPPAPSPTPACALPSPSGANPHPTQNPSGGGCTS